MHVCTYVHDDVYAVQLYVRTYLTEGNMDATSATNVLQLFNVKLLQQLPLDDPMFFRQVEQANLLPLNTGDQIRALTTKAHKVDYFLQHVIETAPEVYLPRLLDVMETCNDVGIKELVKNMRMAIKQGMYI